MTFRTYSQLRGDDRSGLMDQVMAQRQRVVARLSSVKRIVAVTSGKGGVGKSFVAAALAVGAASRLRDGVGLLDADLKGPTTARMLGAHGPARVVEDGVMPITGVAGVKVFSMSLLLEENQPLAWKEPGSERFVWRGVLETGALREFLSDVVWGELDLLIVDLPPGPDKLLDLGELVPELAGAIAVTIPSDESRASVERAIHAAVEARIKLLGVVENMSGYACATCGTIGALFPGNAGEHLAAKFGVPLLGVVPFSARASPPSLPPAVLDHIMSAIG